MTNDSVVARGAGGRDRLLAHAEAVFGAGGSAARVEDVAASAGVSKSLVFRYWPTKEALLAEVALRLDERYRGWIEHARWSDPATPVPAVAAAVVGFFDRPVHALFDPLVHRPALNGGAPELNALDDVLAAAVAGVVVPGQGEAARALVDAAVLATLRGWVGVPSFAALDLSADQLRDAIVAVVEGGLEGLTPLPSAKRRPRRPAPEPLSSTVAIRSDLEGRLLDAALDVFGRVGYDLARLEDIAAEAGTAASAVFTYWSGKEELFQQVRAAVVTLIALRLLDAMAQAGSNLDRLRAAVRANLRVHYERPEFQAVLLPVASLPRYAELESVGWQRTLEQLDLFPELAAAGDLLPVATAMGIAVLRATTLTMHRLQIHPAFATAIAEDYLVGGLARLAALTGVELRTPDHSRAGAPPSSG
jgi:AcrR family transcriptional regulator